MVRVDVKNSSVNNNVYYIDSMQKTANQIKDSCTIYACLVFTIMVFRLITICDKSKHERKYNN